jgi:hypothetical protein
LRAGIFAFPRHGTRDLVSSAWRWCDAADHARGEIALDLKPQIFRAATRGWHERDDKWALPRSVLDDIANAAGAEVRLYGPHDDVGQFRRHLSPEDVPPWAWAIVDRFDSGTFSAERLRDLALEGCIIFCKLAQGSYRPVRNHTAAPLASGSNAVARANFVRRLRAGLQAVVFHGHQTD